ncbi:hypothetical protein, partial [Roseisolibacter sp. H3M3-2]|uniref:hypothetical protein n=1 Tax=Roseisolibacter sp. H3M3-2 TaxID=3031323 RepID=UPI0023DAEBF4
DDDASAEALAPDAAAGGTADAAPERWYGEVAMLGDALSRDIEGVTRRHAARLRADRLLPNLGALPEAQVRDHTGTIVCEVAHLLVAIGETAGRAPELLRDGSEILRLVAELHGAQRHRLGWSEPHFAHEAELLCEEVVGTLRHAAAEGTPDGRALAHATVLVRRLLEQARQTSIRGLHIAQVVAAT